jgi:O-antigen/teichoic acid export membrane protein
VALAARRIQAVLPWRLLHRPSGRHLGWGVADQAMSSVSNFVVSIYVARTLGAAQFGAFSLAYVTYGFVLNASRGLATEPLVVRFSDTDLQTWRLAVARCTGTATVVGLAAGACSVAAGPLLGGTAGMGILALGLTLPGLLLQDSWRFAFFAQGRGYHAFINDAIWAAVLLPALAYLQISGHTNVFWFVLAWGGAAAVAAAVGPVQARVVPSLAGVRTWLLQHRDLGPRYLAENTASSAGGQLRLYAIEPVLGLAALGYIQAAYTLMGPVRMMFIGMSLITVPEAARILRHSPRHLPLFCVAVSGGLALLGLAWGVVLLVALPRGAGHLMLGSMWLPTNPLVLPAMVSIIGTCVGSGANVGLHALGAARRSLRAMLLSSVSVVTFAVAGALLAGTSGMMWCAAAASCVNALGFYRQFQRALHEQGTVPVHGRSRPDRLPGRHRSTSRQTAAVASRAQKR